MRVRVRIRRETLEIAGDVSVALRCSSQAPGPGHHFLGGEIPLRLKVNLLSYPPASVLRGKGEQHPRELCLYPLFFIILLILIL